LLFEDNLAFPITIFHYYFSLLFFTTIVVYSSRLSPSKARYHALFDETYSNSITEQAIKLFLPFLL